MDRIVTSYHRKPLMNSHEQGARPSDSLPSLPVLQHAVRKTTELLAHELALPSTIAPRWSDIEWRVAEAVAVMQGVSALLANRLRWQGPPRWQHFLEEQKQQTFLRRERIEVLLGSLDREARKAGVPLITLKGAALHGIDAYPRGDRPMSDVDLLARETDIDTVKGILQTLGYRPGAPQPNGQIFEPLRRPQHRRFGEHVDHPIEIDLHTRIAERLPVAVADITRQEFPADAVAGLNGYPSEGALMRHLLLHAANNIRTRALRFIQLYDIALLSSRFGRQQWQELTECEGGTAGLWWAYAPLMITARYFPSRVPDSVLAAAATRCPWLLKKLSRRHTLTEVSWSKLRFQAFPGAEWCRTPAQILRFAAERAFPGHTGGAAPNLYVSRPYFSASRWHTLSRFDRALRWAFSSPTRVQSMYPIRVALGIQQP